MRPTIYGNNIDYTRPEATMEQSWKGGAFDALVKSNPNSQRLIWYRATLRTQFDKEQGRLTGINSERNASYSFTHVELPDSVRVLATSAEKLRRYTSQGEIETGDLTITALPDELPLGEHDRFVLLGKPSPQDNPPYYATARVNTETGDSIMRGGRMQDAVQGAGYITSAGAMLVGVNTFFTAEIYPGAVLFAQDIAYTVLQVVDDTHLILTEPPVPAFTNITYRIGADKLRYPHATLLRMIMTQSGSASIGDVVTLSPEGDEVRWNPNIANIPRPGETYTLRYEYLPVYEILGRHPFNRGGGVSGGSLPIRVVARMVNPNSDWRSH